MRKKILLLALSIVAAMAALPTASSATPWHTPSAGTFTLQGGAAVWSTPNMTIECGSVAGAGNYSTTTGGTIDLTVGTCVIALPGFLLHCTTPGQPNGDVITTTLKFDNVMLGALKPGILLTPNTETGAVVHFNCGGLPFTVEGNGLLGTLITPACGGSSTGGTWRFGAIAHGAPDHTLYTGTVYNWKRNAENVVLSMEATIKFSVAKTVTCT